MWNFLNAVQTPDVVEGIDRGRETAVEAEDLIVDQGCEGEVVEKVGEVFPYVGVSVLPETFIIKAVDLSDLAGLVVAAQDSDAARIPNLESNEERDSLDRVVTSINVVALVRTVSIVECTGSS